MASFHCSVKVGGAGKGAAHALYISREGKYKCLLDSPKAEKLECTGYGNLPTWAADDPIKFWEEADARERNGGAVYREIELAIPNELMPEQADALVKDFIKNEIGDKHAFTYAIHNGRAAIDGSVNNRNAHIMFSERTLDDIERGPDQYFKRWNAKEPGKGGCQKSNKAATTTERKEQLTALRSRWADIQNQHLAQHGHTDRVTHLSLKAQGIDRPPEQHLGPKFLRSMSADQISALLENRAAEGERQRAQSLVDQMIDVTADLASALRERDARVAPKIDISASQNQLEIMSNAWERSYNAARQLDKEAADFAKKQKEIEQEARDKSAYDEKVKAEQERVTAEREAIIDNSKVIIVEEPKREQKRERKPSKDYGYGM